MDIFEKAARLKLRFATNKGELSVEELWDLSLQSLDTIAKAVNRKLKEEGEESFIDKKTKTNTELSLKLEVLKSVINTKLEEEEIAKTRAEKRAQASFLKDLLQRKKLNELENLSAEEIEKQLASLENETA